MPVAARAELDAALRVLAAHFQVASDAEAGHEVPADKRLRAELTPQGTGLRVALLAAPFGDFGPRLAPGSGRVRVTTVHQGLTLSTRRDLTHERALFERCSARWTSWTTTGTSGCSTNPTRRWPWSRR